MNTNPSPASWQRVRRPLTMLVAAGLAFGVGIAEAGGNKPPTQTCTTTIPIVSTHDGEASAVDLNTELKSYTSVLGLITLRPTISVGALISDTGRLGPTTNENQKEVNGIQATLAIPSTLLVNVELLNTLTKSMGNLTVSEANILGLDLGVANVVSVSADVLQATAKARLETTSNSCAANTPQGTAIGSTKLTGSSVIANLKLKVLGLDVQVPVEAGPNSTLSVAANTVIHLKHPVTGANLGIDVILNEQIKSGNTIIVNAVHVVGAAELAVIDLLGVTTVNKLTIDLVISHAEASVSGACGAPVTTCGPGGGGGGCTPKDFMTGVGWIELPSGAKGNFGFNGGYKPNGLTGRLNFNDHSTGGAHITGTDVTAYGPLGSTTNTRDITFTCNQSPCVLSVGDFGEPGGGVDTLKLTAGDKTYVAKDGTGTIGNGNVQLHRSSCPATGSTGGSTKPGRK